VVRPRRAGAPGSARLDGWLRDLGLTAVSGDEREGVTSRDLLLDGRRRRAIRLTLVLAPGIGLVAWVQYAPELGDTFRKTYRQLLKWNDELPFVKFALSADDAIVLLAELAPAELDADALGRAIARLVAVCDLLQEASAGFLGPVPTAPAGASGAPDPTPLLDRYAQDLAELAPTAG
jgi:hypothetical protein